ncbi:MAG: hypothetical protein Q7O66_02310, partial [Dehalococcoidia bacterium]|nr:hypothetical protein [Dehalococcoidia bacterium]
MRLPRAHSLIVEREKIISYLLNPEHRYGASKARFFSAFGFRADEWETFAEALREHGRTNQVSQVTVTGFGQRYEVEGELVTPDGRLPRVRTVWQLDQGEPA